MNLQRLRSLKIERLGQLADRIEVLSGYTQMRKFQLPERVCRPLNIEMHEQRKPVDIDKGAIK